MRQLAKTCRGILNPKFCILTLRILKFRASLLALSAALVISCCGSAAQSLMLGK
jgi:hypothetical protein